MVTSMKKQVQDTRNEVLIGDVALIVPFISISYREKV